MPIVHANVWEGFGEEKAKKVIQNITKVFADLGIPAQAVDVIALRRDIVIPTLKTQ